MIYVYILTGCLVFLLLAFGKKYYWLPSSTFTLNLSREIGLVVLCLLLAFVSIFLSKRNETHHKPFVVGSLDQSKIDSINFVDRSIAGRWDVSSKDQGKVYKNIAIYMIPFAVLLFAGSVRERLGLFLIFAQGYVITGGLTGLAKGLVERYRPFTYRSADAVASLDPEAHEKFMEDIAEADITNSFFSGDASATAYGLIFFALAYSLVYSRSKFKLVVWIACSAAVLLECYFRSMSGKHFPSDVLLGAAVGTSIALGIVAIHRRKSAGQVA